MRLFLAVLLSSLAVSTFAASTAHTTHGKCEQSVDVVVLIDSSESAFPQLEVEKRFAADLVLGLSKKYHSAQFGVIAFGPANVVLPLSNVTGEQAAAVIKNMKYQCLDINNIKEPCNTPTDLAIELARRQFSKSGRAGLSQIIFLITDGQPNDPAATYHFASRAKNQGINIVTIGVGLSPLGKEFLTQISSQPPSVYSHADITSFDQLEAHLPEIVGKSCFYVEMLSPNCGSNGTVIKLSGYNLFDTGAKLTCRFGWEGGYKDVPATHIPRTNNTELTCLVPDVPFSYGVGTVEVSVDGTGFSNNKNKFEFKTGGGPCFAALMVEEASAAWWPGLVVPLLLLCCLLPLAALLYRKFRHKKEQPKVPVQLVPAMPAKAAGIEEVTCHVPVQEAPSAAAPDKGKYKWQVQTSSYIGFGKAKMDVDWAGEAPASAPHAIKRFKVSADDSDGKEAQGLTATTTKTDGTNESGMVYGVSGSSSPDNQGCLDRFFARFDVLMARAWACLPACFSWRKQKQKTPSPPSNNIVSQTQPMPVSHVPAAVVIQSEAAVSAPPGQEPQLPPGWEALTSPEGHIYYENRDEQITQWERPV